MAAKLINKLPSDTTAIAKTIGELKSIQSFIISGLQVHVDKPYQQQTIKEDKIINKFEKIENHSDQKLIGND
jgi:hypothetical protein